MEKDNYWNFTMNELNSKLPKNWGDNVEENIRSGLIEIWILSMLLSRDMYAYELKLTLMKRIGGNYFIRDGSMYGPLYRMLDRQLISSRQENISERKYRNYYHIEDLGKKYLEFSIKKFYEIFSMTDSIIKEHNPEFRDVVAPSDESAHN